MDKLSLKSFNNQWDKEENATGFEWLTRDKAEVKKYIDDPWSGFISPASFYLALFDGMEKIWTPENGTHFNHEHLPGYNQTVLTFLSKYF